MGGRNNKLKDQKDLDQKGSGKKENHLETRKKKSKQPTKRNSATVEKDHFKSICLDENK